MSLLANKRRKRPEMNLVPLIDVLVMLIFFAFVTMQFKSASTLNITLPKVETAGKNEFRGNVTISIGNFKGYWHKPEATAKTLRDGWVHTGDMGHIDADGYLTFTGRFKEMIKVSGYAVFPEEVETILIKHPAVAQAAVIGVPDPTKGEVIRAFIVKKPGQDVSAQALIDWARENMSSYKAPREVRFIDALPATGAGKVLRRLLKDPA